MLSLSLNVLKANFKFETSILSPSSGVFPTVSIGLRRGDHQLRRHRLVSKIEPIFAPACLASTRRMRHRDEQDAL